jgi:hypothetical protein
MKNKSALHSMPKKTGSSMTFAPYFCTGLQWHIHHFQKMNWQIEIH